MEMFEYEKKHMEFVRNSLAECTVLLKKDGKFPLEAPGKIAVYGNGVRKTVKGGTGSGEVNSHFSVNIEQGLIDAGFEVTTGKWLDAYEEVYTKARQKFVQKIKKEAKEAGQNVMMYSMGKMMPEPEYKLPLDDSCDTAIYVLSRISGEGSDRPVEKGEILLTDTEKRDILALNKKCDRFMLVLNVGGVVDLSGVSDVKNILLLSQLGAQTGFALADILLGKQNPSGRLTTTWAEWSQYFPMDDFENRDETCYREGIYVGYRYFDTFHKNPVFPFGYGLSYTEFELSRDCVKVEKENVSVNVTVKNIGHLSGKEVVQAYLSVPPGLLDQPYQVLCGYAKTDELVPGTMQQTEVTFNLCDFAAYDEKREAYVLEAGDYIVRVGRNSRDTKVAAILQIETPVITRKVHNVLGKSGFEELKPHILKKNGNGSKEEWEKAGVMQLPSDVEVITVNLSEFGTVETEYGKKYEILPEIEALSDEEAALINIGGFDPKKKGMAAVVGSAGNRVCGAAGETTSALSDFPVLVMADGPAGLRLAKEYYEDKKGLHTVGTASIPDSMADFLPKPVQVLMKHMNGNSAKPKAGIKTNYQYCTAIPVGTAVAQSFNDTLAASLGEIVGEEMQRFGVNLWLAPALNIHRSIRCGRNFEYYSEDPLLSGKMAAAITRGVQKHRNCGVVIKHFAANNKELNRYCNNSRVSERAMREIYLRGFEICVREANPCAVMTSYNLLNGTHTAEHRGLIEDILRAEFGFDGIVMTDWIVAMAADKASVNRNSKARYAAAAGGDLFMPGGKADYDDLKEGLKTGEVSAEQIRINATRVLKLARRLCNI